MATTTVQAFNEFNASITPTAATRTKVYDRRDTVVDVLRKAFPGGSDIVFGSAKIIGSLGRSTATNPVADIDLMVHMKVTDEAWRKYQNDSAQFLYRIRNAVNGTSRVQKIGARGQAVSIFYADGLTVDVASMVQYTNGGYGIPDGGRGWLTTDPIRHETYLDEQNALLDGDLKKVIRLAKKWNKAHSSRLSSFHLEMLVARTFGTLGNDSREALRLFFDHNRDNLTVMDPAHYSGDLSSYLSYTSRDAVNDSLNAARDRAELALAAERRGDHKESIRQWGIVLGKDFPSYG
ncbi:hypothetical protein GV791_07205 [Nocardia cyriacigeorgica]|uniref:Nucleotidyltransferase n=1 Tax=Nocardia cyriacigeorgica TaxID=135487 RepID=A0A6P1CIV1_9NOCA|nr:hypothetical protein [Nocardia cyriacigeorgica]NEW32348.1 hypothetical protein [Nocardia cyriacigeorgica]